MFREDEAKKNSAKTADSRFTLREDLTLAVMERMKRGLEYRRRVEKHNGNFLAALLEPNEEDRFYGTVLNQETLQKIRETDAILDVLETLENTEVQRFSEPDPFLSSGIVAVTTHANISCFEGAVYTALQKLILLADEMTIISRANHTTRIVFDFNNMWSEHRELTDEEMEYYNNDYEEECDYEF